MPFDPIPRTDMRHPAAATPAQPPARPHLRPVALWLFGLSFMVLVMVTLGGATRLTGSGLSIMEWAPLLGTLPPLSDAEWQRLFTLYQHIPQYDLVNQGFGIEGFKNIFWLEWAHRLWGRLMGTALLIPLLWFAVRGRLDRTLGLRIAGLFVLGGLQGGIGWFMVASGFDADRTSVSAYRLVAHLSMAVALYAALLLTALGVWRQAVGRAPDASEPGAGVRRLTMATACSIAVTIIAGGFVAGLHAGLTYNSFPLMDGRLVPAGYGELHPFIRNLFENVAAVQFDHRVLATLTAVLATATAVIGLRSSQRSLRRAMAALGVAVLLQYALGVTTLLYAVPVVLGTAHQALAMLVLTAALVALHVQTQVRRRPTPAVMAHPALDTI